MRQYLQALPLAAEFAIVILGAFGIFFLTTFLSLVTGDAGTGSAGWYTGEQLFSVIAYELPIGLLLYAFLRERGWSLKRLGVRITAIETLVGFGLAFLVMLAWYAAMVSVMIAAPKLLETANAAQGTPGGFGLGMLIVLSIVNPMFEETFVCGYVISVLKERSDVSTAITISVAIRLLYHLYQGAFAFIGIIPFGLIIGAWYARTGRLWPAIVAHGLCDFIAFVGYVS